MKEFVRSFIVRRIQGYIAMAFYDILEKGWAMPAPRLNQALEEKTRAPYCAAVSRVRSVESESMTAISSRRG